MRPAFCPSAPWLQPRSTRLLPHSRHYHGQSIYGPGPRIPRDREQRARFRFLVRLHLQARRITHACAAIAEQLLRHLGADGELDPTYDTLAVWAACSARTARRATASMLRLGLLSWQRRLVRDGDRALQTSNQYVLLIGASVHVPLTGGQNGRESPRKTSTLSSDAQMLAARDRQLILLGYPQLVPGIA